MNLKKTALSLLVAASSLFAIDAVTSLSVSAPHNSGTTTSDAGISFTWTPPTGVTKYYYKLDTNSTNYNLVSVGGYSTLNSSSATTLSITATASGSYYLHLVAVDSGNLSSAPVLAQVTSALDLDAGAVTMSPNGGSVTTATNSITLTGSESGTIYYTVDGTTPTTSSSVYSSALTLGVSATVKALLKDTAGNTGVVDSNAFTITNNPTVLKANDDVSVDGTTISTSTTNALKVSATDLTRYQYKKSTDSTWTTVNSLSSTIDISALSSASYTYDILGGDAYNFQASSAKTSVTFTVDNTAPTSLEVLVNGVKADETNSTTVTYADNFTFTLATNDTANSNIYYTTDGSNPSKTSTVYGSAVTTSKTVATGATGQVVVKMIAYDSLDNASAIKSVTFTIDKKAPTLSMPATASYTLATPVSFSSDDTDSLQYYQVTESSTSPTVPTDIVTSPGAWTKGSTATIGSPTVATSNELHVVSVDKVGNQSAVSSVSFTYQSSGTTILSAGNSVNFGSALTAASNSGSVTITNSGSITVELNTSVMKITGADFNVTSTTCATLSSGATCTVVMSYTPTSKSTSSGTLSVAYSGTNVSELNVTLAGTGLGSVPSVTTTSISATEDTNATGTIAGNDADNDSLTFKVTSVVTNGALTLNSNGSYTYVPNANYNGADSFTVVANDGDYNSSAQVVAITVASVDDPTTFTALSNANKNEDFSDFNITLSATDSDGTVTFEANVSDPLLASVSISGGGVVVSKVANANGVVTVNVTATANGVKTVQSFDLTIASVDDPTTFDQVFLDKTKLEDFTEFTIDLNATDADGTITYGATSSNESVATISRTGKVLTITAIANANGSANINVTATANGVTISESFALNVTSVDDPAVISTTIVPQRTVVGVQTITLDIDATDIDGTITYDANSSDTTIATTEMNSATGVLSVTTKNVAGNSTITVIVASNGTTLTDTFVLTVKNTDIVADINGTNSYNSDTNETTSVYSGLENGQTLTVNKKDSGKVSATLGTNSLAINVTGADLSIDANGNLTTKIVDGSISKKINVKIDGTVLSELNTTAVVNTIANAFSGDVNTTITEAGAIETKLVTTNNATVSITLDMAGKATSSILVGSNTTRVETTTVDTDTTVDASGNVKAKFNIQNRVVELDVSATDGLLTPTISGALLPTTPFPAGTKATVNDTSSVKFEFILPATLTFN